jgi:tetratricopeptide (TPR) repeat protein
MGFFNIYPMRYSFVADHFQYLASLPMIAMVVFAIHRLGPKRVRPIIAAIALIVLFTETWIRAGIFRDGISLWRDTIQKNPASWMAVNNLGMALIQRADSTGSPNDLTEAGQLLRQALRLRPQHEWAHFGLGKLDEMRGDFVNAKAEFQREARIEPDYSPTYFELGMIAWNEHDWATAQEMFERSRELDSKPPHGREIPVKSARTRQMLARLYRAAGRNADAQRMLEEARRIGKP